MHQCQLTGYPVALVPGPQSCTGTGAYLTMTDRHQHSLNKHMVDNVSIGSVHHEPYRRNGEKKSEGEIGNIRLLLTYALTDHIA
jgi:hypothetical protein